MSEMYNTYKRKHYRKEEKYTQTAKNPMNNSGSILYNKGSNKMEGMLEE